LWYVNSSLCKWSIYHHLVIQMYLLFPWYSWTIAHLAIKQQLLTWQLNNNYSLTCSFISLYLLCKINIKGLSNSQNSSFSYRLQSSHGVDIICATWADYNNDFVHLKPKFNNQVVEAGQKRVLMEFLRCLFTK
jgi:hypothetical protein